MSADLENQLRADLARVADGVGEPTDLLRLITARAREQGARRAKWSRWAPMRNGRRNHVAVAGLAAALVLAAPVITVLLVRAGREAPRAQPVSPPTGTARPSPTPTVPTSAFDYGGYRFELPTTWKRYPHYVQTTPGSNYGYLSTVPAQDPCSASRRKSATECGTPFDRLDPNGVLLELSAGSLPNASMPATSTVAGGPARISEMPVFGECAEVGGQRQITVELGRYDQTGTARPTTTIYACFAGPNPQIAKAQLTIALNTATRAPQ
jgi:hypothetical protein